MADTKAPITVETTVQAPLETVWRLWTEPEHIKRWNNASEDWHTPRATVDLRVGGRFVSRMEARDGSAGFDFGGTFTTVMPAEKLEYTMDDGRRVSVAFEDRQGATHVSETFDPEDTNPLKMQRAGWQAILDNFRTYAESHAES